MNIFSYGWIITIAIKVTFIMARGGIRILPEIISRIRKSESKIYQKIFYNSEQEMPKQKMSVLIHFGFLGEYSPAKLENGVKTIAEFVRILNKVEVPKLIALR